MAIAFDAFTASAPGTGTLSATHTPVGVPRGVIVAVIAPAVGTDQVNVPTYGGVTMSEVALSPLLKAAAEAGSVHIFFLGSSIPTGPQTVEVTVSGGATKQFGVWTVTATGDTAVVDTTSISSDSLANPSGTLSLGGESSFCALASMNGATNVITSCTPLTNWTSDAEWDPGAAGGIWYHYDIIGTTDVTFGYTAAADDVVCLGIAIRQSTTDPTAVLQDVIGLGIIPFPR